MLRIGRLVQVSSHHEGWRALEYIKEHTILVQMRLACYYFDLQLILGSAECAKGDGYLGKMKVRGDASVRCTGL